jgi:hypothetical protein
LQPPLTVCGLRRCKLPGDPFHHSPAGH